MSKKIHRNKKRKIKEGTQHCSETKKFTPQGISLSLDQAYKLALRNFQSGNFPEAEQLCQQLLNISPDNADGNYLAGLIAAQQGGKDDIAIRFIQKTLAINPNFAKAHNNLGFVFHRAGKMGEAIASYRKALSLKPDYAKAHNNLGNIFQEQDKMDEAVASYRKALSLEPDYAEAHNNLGVILQKLDKLDEAVGSFQKALSLNPGYAEAYNNLGLTLHKQEKVDEAIACYMQALSLNPNYAEAHNNLGLALHEQEKTDSAFASFRQALSLKPDYAEAYNNIGFVLKELGRFDEAGNMIMKALSLNPDSAEAYNNLGLVFQEMHRMDDAIASYRKALSLKPDLVAALNNIGLLHRELGNMDEAIEIFREAVAIKPQEVAAYMYLSSLVRHNEFDDIIQAMEDLHAKKDLSDKERMHLSFTLGKVFEDLKEYKKSFGYILEANRLKRRSYEYSIQADLDKFAAIKKIFSPGLFSFHAGGGNQDATPIFILGMPRSGTTLVEQILSSHSQIFGAGELLILANMMKDICSGKGAKPYPACIPDLDTDMLKKMGSDYIDAIRKYSETAKYITDKLPHNFFYVGLIKIILPHAKIIHCMRNPMDNCLSIFKNDFKGSLHFAYDMVELGRYYSHYRDLMEHWEEVLPGFMYSLRYEELVSDQQNQTKRLLQFCGLPWEEACLAFHKTERRVKTASFAQVRKPMYRGSVELWKKYETELEALRRAIEGK